MYYLDTASIALVTVWVFFFLIVLIQHSPKDPSGYKTKYFQLKMATANTLMFGPSIIIWTLTANASDKVAWYTLSVLVPLTSVFVFRTKTANDIFESFIDKRDI